MKTLMQQINSLCFEPQYSINGGLTPEEKIGEIYVIAKQMDALLEECYAGFKNEGMYDYYTKLEKAGYGV